MSRRQRAWATVAVVAIILLALALVGTALSAVGGAAEMSATHAPLDRARTILAAEGKLRAEAAEGAAPAAAKRSPVREPHPGAVDPVRSPEGRVFRVNLNAADEAQLERVPGLGRVKAKRILAWRAMHRFVVPADVMKVKGFGPKTYAKMKTWLAVDGPPIVGTPPRGARPRGRQSGAEPSGEDDA